MNVPQLRFSGFEGEWSIKNFDEVFNIIDGDRGKNYPSSDDYLKEGFCLFLNAKNVSKKGFIFNDTVFIDESKDRSMTKGKLNRNDIVMTTRGTIGNIAFYNREVPFENIRINSGMVILRSKINDHLYNFTFLSSSGFDKTIKFTVFGSAQPQLTVKDIRKMKISFPQEKEEQKKISSFFLRLNQRIEKQQEKIEKLEQFKKGMMQKVFSQELRFKDEDGGEFQEWELQSLNNFTKRVVRKNKGIQSTRPLTISAQMGLVDQKQFFNKNVASTNTEGYYLLKNGEFAYNKSYSNGYPWGAIKRLDKYEDGVLSTLYICFEPLENVDSDFLSIYFETTFWYKEISLISGEGARNHGLLNIGVNDFFETQHNMPSIKEQEKIAEYFMQLNRKIDKEKEKLMVLEEQKRGFMHTLFI